MTRLSISEYRNSERNERRMELLQFTRISMIYCLTTLHPSIIIKIEITIEYVSFADKKCCFIIFQLCYARVIKSL